MRRHIHIHLPAARVKTQDSEAEGKWVTINGAHVFIQDGKITKGPKALVGKKPDEAAAMKNERHGKQATVSMATALASFPEKRNTIANLKEGESIQITTGADTHTLTRRGDRIDMQQGKKKTSKAEAAKQAKEEYAKANAGKGSYAKAAELFDAAGMKDKAASARALAKRYGHDEEGQKGKSAADKKDAAATEEEAASATGEHKKVLQELADAYHERSKDPENNELSGRISALKDRVLAAQQKGSAPIAAGDPIGAGTKAGKEKLKSGYEVQVEGGRVKEGPHHIIGMGIQQARDLPADSISKHKPGTEQYHVEQATQHHQKMQELGPRHPDYSRYGDARNAHESVLKKLGVKPATYKK